jgi:outer membrane protein OmpA-like peptidoglycan-associated protein
LLGLLAYAFTTFASETIEDRVRTGAAAALKAAGHEWATMSISGQEIVLKGTPPSKDAGDAALEIARAATCGTWTGDRVCATRVSGAFDQVAALAPTPAPAPVAAPAVIAAKACETSLAALLADRKIEFATNKATVLSSSNALLDQIAAAAKDCPGVIEVQGHTDSVGAAASNQRLSEARANAVASALMERGFAKERLKASGFGLEKPIADNGSAEGRAQNRRIEFKVVAQ